MLFWEEAGCNPREAEVKLLLQDIHYCHQAAPVWAGERRTDRCHGSVTGREKAVVIILWFTGVKWNLINKRNVPHSPFAVLYKPDRVYKCCELAARLGVCTEEEERDWGSSAPLLIPWMPRACCGWKEARPSVQTPGEGISAL